MSVELLSALVLVPTAGVVATLFAVMWRERRSADDARTAVIAGGLVAAWAVAASVFAARGGFLQVDSRSVPPVGIAFVSLLVAATVALWRSASLRRLLTNQKNLIRLQVWRLEGAVFLSLMFAGQLPALFALPAGVGDMLVGATAFWVASRIDQPGGKRRAVLFNVLGLTDLIVAVTLGVTTNRGPAQLFLTTPSSTLLTQFPLTLVPTFLVPLVLVLHVISLRQMIDGRWAAESDRGLTPPLLTSSAPRG
jgi:hypothetical protein